MRVNKKEMRNWIKRLFKLYDINDLIVGGHCGCCGKWIPDEIFWKSWPWGLCKKCRIGRPLRREERF